MTSKEHIESLRHHGVRLLGWDGTTKEIPADFHGRTVDEALKRFHMIVDRHINYWE